MHHASHRTAKDVAAQPNEASDSRRSPEVRIVVDSPATLQLHNTKVCATKAQKMTDDMIDSLTHRGVPVASEVSEPNDLTVELVIDVLRGRHVDNVTAIVKIDGVELKRFRTSGVIRSGDDEPGGCGAFVGAAASSLAREIDKWRPGARRAIAAVESQRAEGRKRVEQERIEREQARLEAEAAEKLAREEREKACEELAAYVEKGDMARLATLAGACPEKVSDDQKAWLAAYELEQTMTTDYERAKGGNSQAMRGFYNKYYETGDPRVEEIRKLAVKRFGPDNPARFLAARRSIRSMSSKHFFADLCQVRGGEATTAVRMSTGAAVLSLGSLLTGGVDSSHFQQKVDALEESKRRVAAAAKARTGARTVSFMLMGNCNEDHWYLEHRPWPPAKKPAAGAK